MAATTRTSTGSTQERESLMFLRDNPPVRSRITKPDAGSISRFYRFIYPNLRTETIPPAGWLETLIQRNSWLR